MRSAGRSGPVRKCISNLPFLLPFLLGTHFSGKCRISNTLESGRELCTVAACLSRCMTLVIAKSGNVLLAAFLHRMGIFI